MATEVVGATLTVEREDDMHFVATVKEHTVVVGALPRRGRRSVWFRPQMRRQYDGW